MSVRLQSCACIMAISAGMGRLSYLVSTNDLAMRGAKVSANDGNVPFLLQSISASEGFLKIFFLTVYAFCTETDIHGCNW